MSVGILAAKTGNGHVSVMNTLKRGFEQAGYHDVLCFPSFYEDMMVSNRVLSGFYNFLMVNSVPLCEKYCEYTFLTRYDLSEDFYEGVHDFLVDFITSHDFEVLVSVSHTINYSIMKVLKELDLSDKIKFCEVVTDPFDPIAVGYAVEGADKYFCANETVKEILLKNKISPEKIVISGYPVNEKFLTVKRTKEDILGDIGLSDGKKTILMNSSAQGIQYYFELMKLVTASNLDLQIILICGTNENLYNRCKRYVEKKGFQDKVKVLGFVDNLEEYVKASDIVLTKPGANSFYEVLYTKKLLLIDAVDGFLFQERGVQKFVEDNCVGRILYKKEEIADVIQEMLTEESQAFFLKNVESMNCSNGCETIISNILEMR